MVLDRFYVIDSHCHIYPEKIAAAAIKATDAFYGVVSELDGSMDTLISQMAQSGVDLSIVQSVATTPKQVKSINNFISSSVKQSGGKFIGLGALHPDSEDIEADINEVCELGFTGVKIHPDIQRFKVDDYRCLKIYELCEKKGLKVLMHTGDNRYDNSNPNRLVGVLEGYPNLTVIGAHLGGYSVWDEASEKLSGFENFYVDTSSTISILGQKKVKEIIEKYTVDKVLFGTDYPMFSQKREIDWLVNMGFSDEELEKIFSKNAMRVFGIKK